MLKIKNIIVLLFIGFLLIGCGADRAGDASKGVLGVNNDKDNDGLSNEEELIYGTDSNNSDTDGDGLKDGEEINTYSTNATNPDTDGDGLKDGEEINTYSTNATNPDTDGDGLTDGEEINTYSTNATNPDTDGDGLKDGEEINTYGTNVTNPDTDNDGLLDGLEINTYDTNATNPDTDNDGLLDGLEINTYDTNATNPDTDNDGLLDGLEINTYDTNATNPDTDGDGLTDAEEINSYITDPKNTDTDADGLKDNDELSTYNTDPTKKDTDADGLDDGEEVVTYGTKPLEADTDSDGLKDGEEIKTYETNATNPDTDGDCLLDGFEVLNYETNATNVDTDGDKVNDGIEIYSNVFSVINTSCIDNPETLANGVNVSPAKDNKPDAENDVIDALDPSNDSDGDGDTNINENNCTRGDPLNATKVCIPIVDSRIGLALAQQGYAYVPGGFDVDGDGVNEGGFWISRYQARKSLIEIPSEIVIDTVDNINQYISKNFKVLNRNVHVLSYNETRFQESGVVAGNELIFDATSIAGLPRISTFTPYLAQVCLSSYILKDSEDRTIDINISMPTMKQYIHVKRLLDADNANGGDGRHVRNGLLGNDPNVPLLDYSLVVDEFGEDHKEFLRNLIQLRDTTGTKTFTYAVDVKAWWDVDPTKFTSYDKGSLSTQDLGYGIGAEKDAYAVIVRGGRALNLKQGSSGALTDDLGVTNGISFRAATTYIY